MKMKINFSILLAIALSLLPSKGEQLFDGYLALIEIVEAHPVNPDQLKEPGVLHRVHKMVGRVVEVYDGSSDVINERFPISTPPYHQGNPEELTHFGIFEGVISSDKVDIGSRAVTTLIRRKNYNVSNRDFNPWRVPFRSIFFPVNENSQNFAFDTNEPGIFKMRKDWGEWIRALNGMKVPDLQIAHLVSGIANENALISVSSVHLFKRLYPVESDVHFKKIIFAHGTSFVARLAIDHEFCLSNEKEWIEGGHKQLQEILINQSKNETQGAEHLRFRELMIASGSWFGRAADGE